MHNITHSIIAIPHNFHFPLKYEFLIIKAVAYTLVWWFLAYIYILDKRKQKSQLYVHETYPNSYSAIRPYTN